MIHLKELGSSVIQRIECFDGNEKMVNILSFICYINGHSLIIPNLISVLWYVNFSVVDVATSQTLAARRHFVL